MPSSLPKELYNPKAFFIHAAWLRQGCPHCAIFPTAASRRSLDRVSVPMWGTFLSEPLPIEGLVSRYPANFLMGRTAIHHRPKALLNHTCIQLRPSGINLAFASLSLCDGQVRYALLTRAPVAGILSKLSTRCPTTCMC